MNKERIKLIATEMAYFVIIVTFVIITNSNVISVDMMYAEQPLMYLANQTIHSLGDFVNIYMHPQMLHVFSIPFFRPSGHFLLYQLLTPLFGWHNTQALLMVNLIFLAMTGYLMVKIYPHLFPGYRSGGYVAFSLYLINPALTLSRLIILHFEFAYVFFSLLSLYCFVIFCKKRTQGTPYFSLIIYSLFFYFLACTFKEPAVMLGPVLGCYFLLTLDKTTEKGFFHWLFIKKENWQILTLLTVVTVAITVYLTLPWPSFTHPLGDVITTTEKLAASKELLRILLAWPFTLSAQTALYQPLLLWRAVVFPVWMTALLWVFYGLLILTMFLILFSKQATQLKKSVLFLGLTALIFLILPIQWSMALPWHLSLNLLSLSLLMGFSGEYLLCAFCKNPATTQKIAISVAILIGLMVFQVNQRNIHAIYAREGFALTVARNAIYHPPKLQKELNKNTVVVIEDSILHNSYALGNSGYTFFSLGNFNFDAFQQLQNLSFLKYQAIYNGTLFKWAYLLPDLQEEVYPFQVENLKTVPDIILYNWLQHYDDLVCLGYDQSAQWHDRSILFKKNLKKEKANRLLQVHTYVPQAAMSLNGKILYTKKLTFSEHQMCQYECDQNIQCKGFTYEYSHYQQHSLIKCQFYEDITHNKPKFCATCIGFVKQS